MRFGQTPRKAWHSAQELARPFSALNMRLNNLMVLDHVWTRLTGPKGRFWALQAVKGDTLYVKVTASVARNELLAQRPALIRELNKHFERPWIHQIEIL